MDLKAFFWFSSILKLLIFKRKSLTLPYASWQNILSFAWFEKHFVQVWSTSVEITCQLSKPVDLHQEIKTPKSKRSIQCASFQNILPFVWVMIKVPVWFEQLLTFRTVWRFKLFSRETLSKLNFTICIGNILRTVYQKDRTKRRSPFLVLVRDIIIYVPSSLVFVKAGSLHNFSFFLLPLSR